MVILTQVDLDAAIDFYQQLGFRLNFHLPNKWAEFALGEIKLGLFPGNEKKEHRTGIVFEVDNIKQFFQKLNNKIEFVGDPVEKLHGIMVSVKDPNNNIIDFYQPTPRKLEKFIKKIKEKE